MPQPFEDEEFSGLFQELVMQIGLRNACRLCTSKGGREVYIPAPDHLNSGHWLVKLLGSNDAEKVARYMGGAYVDLPLGPYGGTMGETRQCIKMALAAGQSMQQIAEMYGVTVRTVRRHKNAAVERPKTPKTDENKEIVRALQRQAGQIDATPMELMEVVKLLLRRVPEESLKGALQRIRRETAAQVKPITGASPPEE